MYAHTAQHERGVSAPTNLLVDKLQDTNHQALGVDDRNAEHGVGCVASLLVMRPIKALVCVAVCTVDDLAAFRGRTN